MSACFPLAKRNIQNTENGHEERSKMKKGKGRVRGMNDDALGDRSENGVLGVSDDVQMKQTNR